MRLTLLALLVPLAIFSNPTFAREGFGKPASAEEFAKGLQGCWDERIPADEPLMVSRSYCFSGGLKGHVYAIYVSIDEGLGEAFDYELRDNNFVLMTPPDVSYAEVLWVCDAVVFPKQSLKLDCKGERGKIYMTFSPDQDGMSELPAD